MSPSRSVCASCPSPSQGKVIPGSSITRVPNPQGFHHGVCTSVALSPMAFTLSFLPLSGLCPQGLFPVACPLLSLAPNPGFYLLASLPSLLPITWPPGIACLWALPPRLTLPCFTTMGFNIHGHVLLGLGTHHQGLDHPRLAILGTPPQALGHLWGLHPLPPLS